MRNYLWILGSDSIKSIPKGIASQYLLPKQLVRSEINHNYSEFGVFLVERRQSDRLVAFFWIDSVVEISDGANKGDHVLLCNLEKSFRVFDDQSDVRAHHVDTTAFSGSLDIGFHKLNDDVSRRIITDLVDGSEVRFSGPDPAYFTIRNIGISAAKSRKLESLAQESIRQIVVNLPLSDIWSQSGDFYKKPISTFAFELLRQSQVPLDENEIRAALFRLDPFNQFYFPSSSADLGKARRFDSIFNPIIPGDIKYKKYNSGNYFKSNALGAISKIEESNGRHQDILKDISTYLVELSIQPFESNSVDLMFSINDSVKILEIKSANKDNFFSQASSGVLQLAYYYQEMKKDFLNVEVLLVIEKIDDQEFMSGVKSALAFLGIPTLIYDPEKPIPERFSGIIEFNE